MAGTIDDLPEISTAANSNFPSTVHFAQAKTRQLHNVIVGSDPVQLRFMEQQVGLKAKRVERVADDILLGSGALLLNVIGSYQIDISPEVKKRTGLWSANEIKKGSSAISALVELANTLAPSATKGVKLKRELVDVIGDHLTRTDVKDIREALWRAVWILGAPIDTSARWPEPWDAPIGWLPSGVDPSHRLHSLYRTVVSYALVKTKGPDVVRSFGIKPSKQNWLNSLSLDNAKVYKSIIVLSRWRKAQTPPYIAAYILSAIWS